MFGLLSLLLMALLIIIFSTKVLNKYFYAAVEFAWGRGLELYEKRITRRKDFFLGVIVALIIGVIAGIVVKPFGI